MATPLTERRRSLVAQFSTGLLIAPVIFEAFSLACWLLRTENSDRWDKLIDSDPASNRISSVKQVDPTMSVVKLLPGEPFMLCSSQTYDPAWAASFNRESVKSRQVFGTVNGFWVSVSEKCTVVVELQPQRSFHVGVAVSFSTLLACALYITYRRFRRKKLCPPCSRSTHQPNNMQVNPRPLGDNHVIPFLATCPKGTLILRPLQRQL